MTDLSSLWLAILAATILTHVASAIAWMLLPHHRSDYRGLPDETATAEVLRGQQLTPGFYNLPHCDDFSEYGTPEFREKMERGPVAYLTVLPNRMPAMGKMMLKQLAYLLVTVSLVAYVASLSLAPGAEWPAVLRLVSATSFLAFGFAIIPDAIWYGRPWPIIFKTLGDALFYALVTGSVMAWLWPAAGA